MSKNKRTEAKLVSYSLFFDKTGKLVTERTRTDISKLKTFLTTEEFETLNVIVRETTSKLDKIHNELEAHLNARKMDSQTNEKYNTKPVQNDRHPQQILSYKVIVSPRYTYIISTILSLSSLSG